MLCTQHSDSCVQGALDGPTGALPTIPSLPLVTDEGYLGPYLNLLGPQLNFIRALARSMRALTTVHPAR